AALGTLGTIGGTGNVVVSGSAGANGGAYIVTFQNALGRRDVSLLTVQSQLTGTGVPAATVVTQNQGFNAQTLAQQSTTALNVILNVGPNFSAAINTGSNVLGIASTNSAGSVVGILVTSAAVGGS